MGDTKLTPLTVERLQEVISSLAVDFAGATPSIQRLVRNLVERATEAEARVKELEADRDTLRDAMTLVAAELWTAEEKDDCGAPASADVHRGTAMFAAKQHADPLPVGRFNRRQGEMRHAAYEAWFEWLKSLPDAPWVKDTSDSSR